MYYMLQALPRCMYETKKSIHINKLNKIIHVKNQIDNGLFYISIK